jgi:excisionase family DNA binding protein
MDSTKLDKTWLDIDDVAAMLGVPPSTVRRHAKAGLIPHYRVAKRYRFLPDAIDTWRRNGGTAGGAA